MLPKMLDMMHERRRCQLVFLPAHLAFMMRFRNDLVRQPPPVFVVVEIREPVGCNQRTDL
jgi:hypothetical protein